MHLPENISLIRKRWRESQEEFSVRFGMSRTNVSRYESGEYEASLSFLLTLAKLTGISMENLINRRLSAEEIPPLPVGEGGKAEPKTKSAPVRSDDDLGEFADIRNLAAAVRDLQVDMDSFRQLLAGLDESGKEQLKVFEAIQVVIKYLEKELDESEYREEKKAYLDQLAAILSGKQ